MKNLITACSLVMLLMSISVNTFGDIARPNPSPQKAGKLVMNTGLEIAVDPKEGNARLQIRESDFKALQAALNGSVDNRNLATTVTASSPRTIVAGVLLFLSLSFAGVLIARSKRFTARSQQTIGIALVCVAVLGATAVITRGNAGPPPSYRWRNLVENLKKGESTIGSVNIEVVPDSPDGGSGMKLIIPLRKSGPAE